MSQTNSSNDIDTRYSEEEKRERLQAFEAERLHDEPEV